MRYLSSMIDKHELRAAMRASRKRLAGLDPGASLRAAEHAGDLPPGEIVAVYRAIGSEIDAAVTPDLINTPLLAFDAAGGRLGQGGGYYDRTFAALPAAVRVGFAYAGQALENLPVEAHDIRLHGVLTERGYRALP